MSLKTFVLKLTGAVVVEGTILRAGSLVELVESEAKALLARGKAVLSDADDGVALKVKTDAANATAVADRAAASALAEAQAAAEKVAADAAAAAQAAADKAAEEEAAAAQLAAEQAAAAAQNAGNQ